MLPTWSQRILDILESSPDKSPAGLARACGIKGGSVSGWFGKGKPTKMISGDNLVAAAIYLGTTAEYIMTGRQGETASQSQSLNMDLEMLKSAIVSVKEALHTLGLELDAFLAAPLIAYAYAERITLPRDMSKEEYRKFDAMVTAKLQGELGHGGKQGRIVEKSGRRIEIVTPNKTKTGTRKRSTVA